MSDRIRVTDVTDSSCLSYTSETHDIRFGPSDSCTNPAAESLPAAARRLDVDKDGFVTRAEARDEALFTRMRATTATGTSAGVGGAVGVAAAIRAPSRGATALRAAKAGGIVGAAFQTWSSGTRNLQSYREGHKTAAQAAIDTSKDVAIASGAAVLGAEIGGVIGTFIPVPVLGTAVGIVVGAGAGYLIDNAIHAFVDKP